MHDELVQVRPKECALTLCLDMLRLLLESSSYPKHRYREEPERKDRCQAANRKLQPPHLWTQACAPKEIAFNRVPASCLLDYSCIDKIPAKISKSDKRELRQSSLVAYRT
jgi:hypothetical protein